MTKTITRLTITILLFLFASTTVEAKEKTAYFNASYASTKTVVSKLKKAGFTVLTTYSPAQKGYLKVIVVTNSILKKIARKPKRGFAAIQKILVNSKTKTVLTTNPTYWLKAFLQKDYNSGVASSTKKMLSQALGKLIPTKDILDNEELSGYHFMIGMPYYEDMLKLKKDAKGIKGTKQLFALKLSSNATLYGIKMGKDVESFIDTIGEDKALVLPYTVLIEGGNAYALHAKYYLAISYPLLTMGEFMKISSIPNTIETLLTKAVQ
ncbi:MAG: hypothetical protein LGB06_05730 [Sulfurovum sp.]|nr:hypothetical protein [Sulfurovum sp.]